MNLLRSETIPDNDKVSWLAIGLGSKYMNVVDSQLSKPPYHTFSQFVSDLNNHELHMSSYDELKSIDNNLAFLGVRDS